MKVDLDVPIEFKGQKIQGQTAGDVLFQYLSNYGGLRGELRVATSHILGKIVTAEDKVELNGKELSQLKEAWEKACNEENFKVPLMYDMGIKEILKNLGSD